MRRALTIVLGTVAMIWLAYFAGGSAISSFVAGRFENTIVRLGEGKIVSASSFVHHRLFEAAWLGTLLLAWICLHAAIARWRKAATARRWNWITHSVVAFICVNLWLSQAQRTILFWSAMWQGKETRNLVRFNIKLILARENPVPVQAALMGSSQARAQIDEESLNTLLVPTLRTTELHYPGSRAYDLLLLQPIVSRIRPHYIICYVSEMDFQSSASEVVPAFLSWGELPDLLRRGGHKFLPAENVGYGLLGDLLPVFRLRDVLAQRLFGPQLGQLKQRRYDAALEMNLAERARQAARAYALGDEMQFQGRAFEEFIVRCQRSNQRLIILWGQLNPLLGDAVDPRVRQETLALLRSLATKYPNVILMEDLPKQTAEDYEDLTHVTKPAQERFTRLLSERLREILQRTGSTKQ